MLGCRGCQDLMLEHLYDLLDEADQRAVLAHLDGCPACQVALEQARAQQQLLAAAARCEFPEVQFAPPLPSADEEPAAAAEQALPPTTLPLPARTSSDRPLIRRRSRRWYFAGAVAAAALFLTLGSLAVPAYRLHQEHQGAVRAVEQHDLAVADARAVLQKTREELQAITQERDQQIEQMRHDVKARELRLIVTGPRNVQPGAPAEFQVLARDLNNQPADAEIIASLARGGAVKAANAVISPTAGLAHTRTGGDGKAKRTPADADKKLTAPPEGGGSVGGTSADKKADGPLGETAGPSGSLEVAAVGPGQYKVRIPPTVKLQPGQTLDMLVSARKKGTTAPRDQVVLEGKVQLTAPVYQTHLSTDKPMYQPGEVVRFRSLTLERFSLRPATEELRLSYTLTLPGGSGSRLVQRGSTALARLDSGNKLADIHGPDGKLLRGLGVGETLIGPDDPGGEYTLTVREELGRFSPVSRKFLVNRYQKPRLDKKLDFNRSSYGPGDEVQARVVAQRAGGGGSVKDCPVSVSVTVDDQVIPQPRYQSDSDGTVLVKFRLPEKIERGQGSLSVLFLDGGSADPIVRTIPIVLKKLNVEFFPEGGDLVAGLPNRVYFQARTPLGKPAQLRGVLLEDGRALPGEVATLHDDERPGVNQGNGVFTFTPKPGKKYALRIDSPSGISEPRPLPQVFEDGVVLSIANGRGVFLPEETIPVRVLSAGKKPRSLVVGAYCRGQLLDSVQLDPGQTEVTLQPRVGAGGVCRITVFEELPTGQAQRQLRPVAERLVYRHPRERVDLAISADRRQYVPGQKVNLQLLAVDEKEKFVPAVVLLAVVDRSVLTLADEKTYRTLPTAFLLTSEVRRPEDLEYADFLLGSHPKAAQALDLLLGTQGWRRFAEQDPARFRDKQRQEAERLPEGDRQRQLDEAERLLVMIGQSTPRKTDFDEDRVARIKERFEEQVDRLLRERAEATSCIQSINEEEYCAAVSLLARHDRWWRQAREVGAALLSLALILLILAGVATALTQQQQQQRHHGRLWALGLSASVCGVALFALWATNAGSLGDGSHSATQDSRDDLAQLPTPGPIGPLVTPEDQAVDAAPPEAADDKHPEAATRVTAATPTSPPVAKLTTQPPSPPLIGGATVVPPGVAPGAFAPSNPSGNRPGGGRGTLPGGPRAVVAVTGGGGVSKGAAPMPMRREQPAYGGAGFSKPSTADGGERKSPVKGEARTPENQQKDRAKEEAEGALQFNNPQALGKVDRRRDDLARQLREVEALRHRFLLKDGGKDKDNAGIIPPRFAESVALPPLVVREYTHTYQPPASEATGKVGEAVDGGSGPGVVRSDFTETVYWHPVLILPDGKAEVSFDLCDSVTTFEAIAYAHTLDGRLGAATKKIESRLPFSLAPKVPAEVTATDRIDLPVALSNNTSDPRSVEVKLTEHEGLTLLPQSKAEMTLSVPAEGRSRETFSFRPARVEGLATVQFQGRTGPFADAVRETIRIVPDGFPVAGASSDLLEKSASHRIVLPRWVPGTLSVQVDVYPSTLADLQKGLESLLREPHGCFEQSSTANYPNVLILDYLRAAEKSDPELERRTRQLLERGYKKLTSFECLRSAGGERRGYEWFGGTAPPHEALTAYGLLQFRDMARVFEVDPAMLTRTRDYLLGQRDGAGGFKRNARALDTFGRAPENITNAYIVWALTESGEKDDLDTELRALTRAAGDSNDPYYLSLVALSLANRDRKSDAQKILERLAKMQKEDGHLEATQTSITGSGGQSLKIETTALALLGWLRTDGLAFDAAVRKAARWLGQQRSGAGGFGSTQSTILALKALIAHTQANKRTPEPGELRVYIGEEKVAELSFGANLSGTLTLAVPTPEKKLRPGENRLRVEITGTKNVFPHTLSWACRTATPESAKDSPLRLTTTLSRTRLSEGETARLRVQLANVSGQHQGMATAIIGLPGGMALPEDLKQLKDACRVPVGEQRAPLSAFEIRGRELILYWRDLARDGRVELPPLDLIARVPGEYRGPASRAYLYYNPDRKHWIEPLAVTIEAAK